MKKYILTEKQVKKVIDTIINEESKTFAANKVVSEQDSEEALMKNRTKAYNNLYDNPKVSEQMKKIKPAAGGRYLFSAKKLRDLDENRSNKLYLVKSGDTVDGIVNKFRMKSNEDIMYFNDMLQNDPKKLKAGDVIVYDLRPSGA